MRNGPSSVINIRRVAVKSVTGVTKNAMHETCDPVSLCHFSIMPKNALDIAMDVDDNPRPFKRAKSFQEREPIESSALLLALPSLLAHPPAHRQHRTSLQLAFTAMKRCLGLEPFPHDACMRVELTAQEECRAWTMLAETGLQMGLDEEGGVDKLVEEAVTKAVCSPLFFQILADHSCSY